MTLPHTLLFFSLFIFLAVFLKGFVRAWTEPFKGIQTDPQTYTIVVSNKSSKTPQKKLRLWFCDFVSALIQDLAPPLPTLKTFTSKLEYLLKYPASSFHPAGFIFINFRLLIINLSVNFLSLLFSGSFRSLDLFKKISEQKKIARIITFYNQTKKNLRDWWL